ncbi:MAG TPA: hypothetical protein VGM25_09020 [Caulobacteraceae bacterium]|jgi:hypothetical protein
MRRFRELAAADPSPLAGWLVGVLVRMPGENEPVRQYWAVALADRAKAEWAAADRAMLIGDIASSPWRGTEPVEAIKALTPHAFDWSGLKNGEVKALGTKQPRRWLSA